MKKSTLFRNMKPLVLLVCFLSTGLFAAAQQIAGIWNGTLEMQGIRLRLVFHIARTDDGYSATMDSPDQNARGIPVATTTVEGTSVSLSAPPLGMRYQGTWQGDSIVGTFRQGNVEAPLNLSRGEAPAALVRPQEPRPPYPYLSEEVAFSNEAAAVTLAGTLTLPEGEGSFPAVLLISGSGPQNRDEELLGHKPFLVIADYLTRRGIAVLRYDDRGTARSTGRFAGATTADFADDARSGLAYLQSRREIDPARIGLMGHSEGGAIAPMVAAGCGEVAFIVLLAAPGVRGDSVLLMQERLAYRAAGMSEADVRACCAVNARVFRRIVEADRTLTRQELLGYFRAELNDQPVAAFPSPEAAERYAGQMADGLSGPWMQYFLRYDPAPALGQVRCPILAVCGSKDRQVPAAENLAAIRQAVEQGGNRHLTIKEYPGLNHLFQACTTGNPNEYASIEQTFSPEVLADLAQWIIKY